MAEKSPRRGHNIIFSAQQLDHNASMARDLNKRASNRLRLRKGSIEGHQNTHLNSLNYEMRRLKHELREITQTSGTFDKFGETITQQTMPSKAGVDTSRRMIKSRRTVSSRNARNGKDSALSTNAAVAGNTEMQAQQNTDTSRRKSLSLPTLPSMSNTAVLSPRDPPQLTSRTDTSRVELDSGEEPLSSRISSKPKKETRRRHSRRKLSLEASSGQTTDKLISLSVTDTNGETERFRPVSPRGSSKPTDSSFANLNLDVVKDRIQHRLAQPSQPSTQLPIEEADIDPDIEPYMHVPPDGLPRTVYLLPPLTDLLQEAKKARYVRRPKKHLQEVDMDDPERELGIDEIFSKKG